MHEMEVDMTRSFGLHAPAWGFAALLLACLLGLLAAVPARAAAADYEGTVYLTVSHDGDFWCSDGDIAGEPVAYAAFDLAEVAAVDLQDYDLAWDQYYLTDAEGVPDPDAPNIFKLLICAMERYSAHPVENLKIEGGHGSMYFKHGMFGFDENFNYYLNGGFPVYASGLGATADAIPLADGDFVDLAHYTSWSFHLDSKCGFHYFAKGAESPAASAIRHDFTVYEGRELPVKVMRTSIEGETGTGYIAEGAGWTVYAGQELGSAQQQAVTDGQGVAKLTFDEPGSYVIWMEGGLGADELEGPGIEYAVSSPAFARVTVLEGEPSGDDPVDPVDPDDPDTPTDDVKANWTRLAGANRYETMALIVREAFPGRSGAAVLATGEKFADALAASALAGALGCPIVTTPGDGRVGSQAMAELNRLCVSDVYMMGDERTLPASVDEELAAAGIAVHRVAGADRMATSVATLRQVLEAGGEADSVIIAKGSDFADALSIGPWAYASAAPVLLTGFDGKLTAEEVEAVKGAGSIKRVILVGDERAVPESVEQQLGSGYEYVRLGGANRYETSRLIADWEMAQGLTAEHPVVATGCAAPDAMVGAALAGSTGSVLLLADDATAPGVALLQASKKSIEQAYVLGGPQSVADAVLAALE